MLSTPKYGWSNIKIGDWTDRCSYLDDVPFLLLEMLEENGRTSRPVSGKFDAEGYEYIIVFDKYETHIITETDTGYELKTVEVRSEELAKDLIEDIRRDIDSWSGWIDYGDMSDDERQERKKDLLILCSIVEKRLEG